ncbi:MAG: HEAT repeat domain-containing protein [Chloroflexota bacterium]
MYNDIVIMLIAMFRSLFSDEYRAQQLIADLLDDDLEVASEAAEDLGEMGLQSAVPALLDMLTITQDDITEQGSEGELIDLRQDVVRSLGKIGDERAVPALIDAMYADADRGIRYEAAFALLKIGTPPAVIAVDRWQADENQPPISPQM